LSIRVNRTSKINIIQNDYFSKISQLKNPFFCNLWKLYDDRLANKDFSQDLKLKDVKILIIGCGPVGLRLSIDLALLGLKVVFVEKRDRFSRNNVLLLWPYTIVDLKNLGAKFFFGKFCAGSIDQISIKKLHTVLLKVSLLLCVEVHFNVSFEEIVEPTDSHGWRVKLLPEINKLMITMRQYMI
jgi:hypothetical protein